MTLALCGAVPARAAVGADCQGIVYRLWHERGEQVFKHGEDVAVPSGEHRHLYIQIAGAGQKPIGLSATIGYPSEFGFSGNTLEVLKQVRMEAQNAADKQYGRIRFTAAAEGGSSLGYRIDAVDGGRLGQVPAACRVGQINLHILPKAAVSAEPQAITPREAAEQLVVVLYYGLLHRKLVDDLNADYVDKVQKRGRAGLEEVAETMLSSREFRETAFRRAEERYGVPRRGGKSVTERLIEDWYDALYGRRGQPTKADARQDLEDLDICLKGKAYTIKTCGRLGRTLVNRQLFYDQHRDLLDSLGGGGGGGAAATPAPVTAQPIDPVTGEPKSGGGS